MSIRMHAQSRPMRQTASAVQRAACHAPARRPFRTHSAASCASTVAGAGALVAVGAGRGQSGAGRGGHFCARTAHHGFHSSGRVGSSAQFAAPARMALVPPAVWHHAAQLGTGRMRGTPCQMERHPADGSVCRCNLGSQLALVDCSRGNGLHGAGAGMAVAAP